MGLAGYLSIKENQLKNYKNTMTTTIPTPAVTISPTPKPSTKRTPPKVTETEKLINCEISNNCGGGYKKMTKEQCSNSVCCQIGSSWSIYPSSQDCTNAQKNSNLGDNYPPCTVYYPALNYSQTYNHISPSQCSLWQSQANSNNNSAYPTNSYIQPSTQQDTSLYQEQLTQHQEACNQAVSEWNTQKQQFYDTEYNNYSSSYEAMQVLESRRQTYQQELYNAGCTNTISL